MVCHLTQDRSIAQGGDESRIVGTWDQSRSPAVSLQPYAGLGATISRSNMDILDSISRNLRTFDDPVSAVMGPCPFFLRPDDYGGWFALLACALHAAAGELDTIRPSQLRCSELWKANPIVCFSNTLPLRLHDAVKVARSSKSAPFTWTGCDVLPVSFRSHN